MANQHGLALTLVVSRPPALLGLGLVLVVLPCLGWVALLFLLALPCLASLLAASLWSLVFCWGASPVLVVWSVPPGWGLLGACLAGLGGPRLGWSGLGLRGGPQVRWQPLAMPQF